MADKVQQFHDLVRSLMSPDNDVRNGAEVNETVEIIYLVNIIPLPVTTRGQPRAHFPQFFVFAAQRFVDLSAKILREQARNIDLPVVLFKCYCRAVSHYSKKAFKVKYLVLPTQPNPKRNSHPSRII